MDPLLLHEKILLASSRPPAMRVYGMHYDIAFFMLARITPIAQQAKNPCSHDEFYVQEPRHGM